jgi:hypothetical protein
MPGPPFSNGPRHVSELIDCATGAPASRRGSMSGPSAPCTLEASGRIAVPPNRRSAHSVLGLLVASASSSILMGAARSAREARAAAVSAVQEYSNFTPMIGSDSSSPCMMFTPRRSSHSIYM